MKASELFSSLRPTYANVAWDTEVTGIVSDTRQMKVGAAFVCIAGLRFDSHTEATRMIEQGACLVVTERRLDEHIPQVVVEDTRLALTLLWAAWYGNPQRKFTHVVGITGTNGKTSTSLILRHLLTAAGHRTGLIGTTKYAVGEREYDAPLTTPDPQDLFRYFAEMVEADCDTLIMEVSSHSLSQKRVAGIPFTVGIFTNLTQDHLDYHGTMEAYRKEKEKLFSMCKIGLLNADDPACAAFLQAADCTCYTYGVGAGRADFTADGISLTALGVRYGYTDREGTLEVELAIPGRFSVYNSMAALSCALLLGVGRDTAERAMRTMGGVPGRMQRLPDTGEVSVIVDYAHTPDALENVLLTLRALPHGRIFTVFGCGGDRDPKKRPLMGEIACRLSDCAIVTSDNPRTEDPERIIADILEGCAPREHLFAVLTDRTEAIRLALTEARAGDIVLLAGKGHEEYVIDRTGKHPYSERAIVKAFFEEKA